MTRYFVVFAYDGTNYHGWQIQPNGNSVQEELQKALSTLLRENIEVVGAGRTDAGVHARRMTAHFETERAFDCAQLTYKLGRLLPRDISVYEVYPVAPDMHARFSATLRTYHYYVHTRKNPFLRHYSCQLHYDLDYELMNEAAQHLLHVCHFHRCALRFKKRCKSYYSFGRPLRFFCKGTATSAYVEARPWYYKQYAFHYTILC